MLIVYLGIGLWLASFAGVIAFVVAAVRKPSPKPLPDPAFRDRALREDDRWAGIESEWHAFVDSFGVREGQR